MSDEVEVAPERRASFHGILIGPDGLRSGWSMILFAIPYIGLGAIQVSKSLAASELPVQSLILDEALQLGFLCLVTFVISRIERRPFGAYGFEASGTPSRLRDFGAGLFWGISLLSLLIAGLHIGNFLSFDGVVRTVQLHWATLSPGPSLSCWWACLKSLCSAGSCTSPQREV
jgi:hypothetical protein